MKENYLAKWLNNELSEQELEAFRATPEFRSYEKIVATASRLEGPAFDSEAALQRLKNKRGGTGGRVIAMRPWARWAGVAAALVLMLGSTYYFMNRPYASLESGYAQHLETQLPDASEVLLNAGSEITYNKKEWDGHRRVTLQGEAFFKVAKGKTFTVETEAGEVTVLGTQFNVMQRDEYFVVSCYEGLVRVDHADRAVELPAGTSFRLIDGRISTTEIPAASAPSWTRNESSFRSMPLAFVLEEFERQYNMEVETADLDLTELYTGTFSNTNMNLALQSISAPLELTFEVNGNKVLFYAKSAR